MASPILNGAGDELQHHTTSPSVVKSHCIEDLALRQLLVSAQQNRLGAQTKNPHAPVQADPSTYSQINPQEHSHASLFT